MKKEHKIMVQASLEQFGETQVKVEGYSMWPFIKPGDVIYITPGLPARFFGRVAVYWAESQLIAHRISGKKGGATGRSEYRFTADFVKNSSVFIKESDIVGTVLRLKRGVRTHQFWMRGWGGEMAYFLSFFTKILNFHK